MALLVEPSEISVLSREVLAGCDAGLVVACNDVRGRVLQATRAFGAGEQIASCPRELRVMLPKSLPSNDTQVVRDPREFLDDLSRVEEACQAADSPHGADVYWAALMSLTAEQKPTDKLWPCISAEKQARLLLLHRPASMSSTCGGRRQTLEGHGSDAVDAANHGQQSWNDMTMKMKTRQCKTVATFDVAVRAMYAHFQLRLEPEKLEELVLVWKYNSFQTSNPDTEGAALGLDVFIAPSFCSHSCRPNCWWAMSEDLQFQIFAGEDGLESGEELSISYIDSLRLETLKTHERRELLAWNWLFLCACRRCTQGDIICIEPCSTRMITVLSYAEEEVYPDFNVFCDSCDARDLHGDCAYYYHCDLCGYDLCPACGEKS